MNTHRTKRQTLFAALKAAAVAAAVTATAAVATANPLFIGAALFFAAATGAAEAA